MLFLVTFCDTMGARGKSLLTIVIGVVLVYDGLTKVIAVVKK